MSIGKLEGSATPKTTIFVLKLPMKYISFGIPNTEFLTHGSPRMVNFREILVSQKCLDFFSFKLHLPRECSNSDDTFYRMVHPCS
jgi:hypothetical protein